MNEAKSKILGVELMAVSEIVCLTTIDHTGYPQSRAMFNLRRKEQFPGLIDCFQAHQDDCLVFFTTNTSSAKIAHIRENPRVSVYYCRPRDWQGLMLGGDIQIITDETIKSDLWQPGWELYYLAGSWDSDYTLLQLFPQFGTYYHQLDVTHLTYNTLEE